MIYRS